MVVIVSRLSGNQRLPKQFSERTFSSLSDSHHQATQFVEVEAPERFYTEKLQILINPKVGEVMHLDVISTIVVLQTLNPIMKYTTSSCR